MSPLPERVALSELEPVAESLLTETTDVPREALELDQLLAGGDVHSVCQPIVEFEFVLSHKRELAIQVALVLMSRVWPGHSDR